MNLVGVIGVWISYKPWKFFGLMVFVFFPIFFYRDKIAKRICWIGISFLLYILCEAFTMIALLLVMRYTNFEDVKLLQTIGYCISTTVFYLVARITVKNIEKRNDAVGAPRPEIITVIIVDVIFDIVAASLFQFGRFYFSTQNALIIVFIAVIMMNAMTIYTTYRVIKSTDAVMELNLKMQQIDMENKFTENITDTITELRNLRHDVNNNLSIIRGLLSIEEYTEAENYLESIMKDLNVANNYVFTENKLLDVLINTKINRAQTLGIPLDAKLFVKTFPMTDKDMCALIANILDNAIEGAKTSENAHIHFSIEKKNNNLRIICDNTYSVKPIIKKGKFVSTKSDKKYHGIGTQIITSIVEKYKGKIDFVIDEMFHIDISIPWIV